MTSHGEWRRGMALALVLSVALHAGAFATLRALGLEWPHPSGLQRLVVDLVEPVLALSGGAAPVTPRPAEPRLSGRTARRASPSASTHDTGREPLPWPEVAVSSRGSAAPAPETGAAGPSRVGEVVDVPPPRVPPSGRAPTTSTVAPPSPAPPGAQEARNLRESAPSDPGPLTAAPALARRGSSSASDGLLESPGGRALALAREVEERVGEAAAVASRGGDKDARKGAVTPGELRGEPVTARPPEVAAIPSRGGHPVPREYDTYVRALRQRIQERLTYPWLAVRQGVQGVVELELDVDPEGRFGHARVVGGEGTGVLREAALRAARAASPFPFPPGVSPRPLTIRLPVVFELR